MNDQTEKNMTNDVLDKLAAELAIDTSDIPEQGEAFFAKAKLVELRKGSDIERLLEASTKLYRTKVEERIQAVSTYERDRCEMLDRYRVQMERIHIEAESQLRQLVDSHHKHMDQLDSIIAKLEALRRS